MPAGKAIKAGRAKAKLQKYRNFNGRHMKTKYNRLVQILLFIFATSTASDTDSIKTHSHGASLYLGLFNYVGLSFDCVENGVQKYSFGLSNRRDLFVNRTFTFRKEKHIRPTIVLGLSIGLPYEYVNENRTYTASRYVNDSTIITDTIGIYVFNEKTYYFDLHFSPGITFCVSKKLQINVSSDLILEPYHTIRTNIRQTRVVYPCDFEDKFYSTQVMLQPLYIKLSYLFKT